jgi:hypothetical protein
MPTIIATAGGATSNSYETLAEASTYFDERLPLPTPWIASGDTSIRALIMATRVLDAMAQPYKTFMPGEGAYFIQRKKWTGAPATTTQRLAWPRTGMYDSNGNLIASDVIPQALKDAESELAGQLIIADTTLDNDITVQGITSIKAGSVSLSFKEMIEQHVLPSAVLNLMPPSWLTDEEITYPTTALFEVI